MNNDILFMEKFTRIKIELPKHKIDHGKLDVVIEIVILILLPHDSQMTHLEKVVGFFV